MTTLFLYFFMASLQSIAKELVLPKKGILAADESIGTAGKRLEAVGVDNTEDHRRMYRELLFTTPGIEAYLSGVILFDETMYQSSGDGVLFPTVLRNKGINAGIKVDMGTVAMPESSEETATKGLDGLAERLEEYKEQGATFAKWRAVFSITDELPSEQCVQENAEILAEYARLCQQAGIVPIVEPEVLMTGTHTIERCYEVTTRVLRAVFVELEKSGVQLDGMLLKPNMITPGDACPVRANADTVAQMTVACLTESVPTTVPGIVFLSGGQSEEDACRHLRLMQELVVDEPWELSFSFGRALQARTLETWRGEQENREEAQAVFLRTVKTVSQARDGE
jgi:fructose-bisphosphate aldolase class I